MLFSCHRRICKWTASLARRASSPPRPLVRFGLLFSALWGGPASDVTAHGHAAQSTYTISQSNQQQPSPITFTLEQAVAKVRSEVPGRILSAETAEQDGKIIYRIKVLTPDGRVVVIEIDARSGKRQE